MTKSLKERFRPLIDMTDRAKLKPEEEEKAFLSRAVTALAVKHETGWSDREAAAAVIDDYSDRGIDAVAVEERGDRHHITLVQGKWSEKGNAGFGERELGALFRGLDDLMALEFGKFNSRIEAHADALEKALEGPATVTLVLALVTGSELHPNIQAELKDGLDKRNWVREMIDSKVLNLRDLYQEILGDQGERKITLETWLEGVGKESVPYEAFYGTVSAAEIADWYRDGNQRHLFARNIRDSLDATDVNNKIRATLLGEPQHFWYFSNGITVLCDRMKKKGRGVFVPGAGAGFILEGASVVNGAQTVSAIAHAVQRNPAAGARGRVLVRLISLEDCPEGFGDRVTVAANTQNAIQERDFKSRDQTQFDLRDDFALSLGLSYVIRRGEPEPARTAGCTMTEAATALAATHRTAEMGARAKRDPSLLWEKDNYRELFGRPPSAFHVWGVVRLLREVRDNLEKLRSDLFGRVASAAGHADLLIAHAIYYALEMRAVGGKSGQTKDQDIDWDARLAEVPLLTAQGLGWFVAIADTAYGDKSQYVTTARTAERVTVVARRLRERLLQSEPAPDYGDYQITEQAQGKSGAASRAVPLIVEAGRLEEGTRLEFRPVTKRDRQGLPDWIKADPRRGRAVWRNHKTKPLVWEADGEAYAPSPLARLMRGEAMGNHQQVQGTRYWHVPGEGSLSDIAADLRATEELDAGTETYSAEG
ncbi:AIPR family protein [Streptomyces sp. ME02-6978a]|uniref:AIPR family protein n=1 Tax=unclassified Streptomyces TaxID=2593676 RepID=UPI0029AAA3F5|nr:MULTISPECIES: AIPR family protein [unclassified Streptomyces]MDX3091557.1 AIPR family protein [Streptomyces sp. ME12-02E]MDX3335031.1 AIPR family protein [Streptomyces sp. ME02-6978a]